MYFPDPPQPPAAGALGPSRTLYHRRTRGHRPDAAATAAPPGPTRGRSTTRCCSTAPRRSTWTARAVRPRGTGGRRAGGGGRARPRTCACCGPRSAVTPVRAFLDMREAGRNPGRIIPGVLRAFADAHRQHAGCGSSANRCGRAARRPSTRRASSTRR